MGKVALIGLGSNLGDRKAILDAAVEQLCRSPEIAVRSVSTYHQTMPVGGPTGQGPFLNAAAALDTTLEPLSLLHRLQEVESDAGRVRSIRWGERTLDLDLLLHGHEVIRTPELTVPHPRMAVRRFVLVPLEEIAPDARDPLTGRAVSELRTNLDRRPSYLALEGWWNAPEKRPILERVVTELNTGCWSQRDLEEQTRRGLLGESNQQPFGVLERTLEFLAADHRSVWGDQWIVTDFTVADLVATATARWGPISRAKPGSLVSRLAARELDLVEPTFIVEGPGPAHRFREPGALHRSTPRLALESPAPDRQVSEIVAACAATRT